MKHTKDFKTALSRFDNLLKNADAAKGMLILLTEVGELTRSKITSQAVETTSFLSAMGLINIDRVSTNGVVDYIYSLSGAGREILQERKTLWADELSMWEELEGERQHVLRVDDEQQTNKQLEHFRKVNNLSNKGG